MQTHSESDPPRALVAFGSMGTRRVRVSRVLAHLKAEGLYDRLLRQRRNVGPGTGGTIEVRPTRAAKVWTVEMGTPRQPDLVAGPAVLHLSAADQTWPRRANAIILAPDERAMVTYG